MAEARGLRNFLVTESLTDSLALAQHVAGATSRIQVGTGITNLYLRHPLLAALHTMTIDYSNFTGSKPEGAFPVWCQQLTMRRAPKQKPLFLALG